jgi:hypothetical protein
MRMTSIRSGLLITVITAGTVAAQAPAPGRARGIPGRATANLAQHFLAHTAQLQLNDQQVTRLAAIARRAESRDQARRVAFDSLRARSMTSAADSATRVARRMELANSMRTAMERARDERHADLRDALAVLNADQQARAWELRPAGRGARAAGERGIRRGGMGRAMRRGEMRRGEMRRGEMRPGVRPGLRSGTRRPI